MRATLAIAAVIVYFFVLASIDAESQNCNETMISMTNVTSCFTLYYNTTFNLSTPNNTGAFCKNCSSSLVAYYQDCPNVTVGPGVENITKSKFMAKCKNCTTNMINFKLVIISEV